jgi:hypothetical protein
LAPPELKLRLAELYANNGTMARSLQTKQKHFSLLMCGLSLSIHNAEAQICGSPGDHGFVDDRPASALMNCPNTIENGLLF